MAASQEAEPAHTGAAGDDARIEADAVAAVVRRLAETNTVLQRLEALEQRVAHSAEEVTRLGAVIAEQGAVLETSARLWFEFAGSGASTEAQRERAEAALERARDALGDASPRVAEELGAVIEDLRRAPLEHAANSAEVERRVREMEKRFSKVEGVVRDERKRIEKRIAQRCTDEPVSPEVAGELAAHVDGDVPGHWTAELADVAIAHGITLPHCMRTADGGKLEREMRTLRNDVEALERAREFTVKDLLRAIAYGLALPGILLVKFLACLFGHKSCRSGGSGGGQGKGEGKVVDQGKKPGSVPPAGTKETRVREVGKPPQRVQAEREGEAGGTNGSSAHGDAGLPRTVAEAPKVTHVKRVHGNVAEGVGTVLEVRGNLLTLIDTDTDERWYATWPPRMEFSTGNRLPPFTDEVRVIAADVEGRRMVLDVPMETCRTDPVGRLEVVPDPESRVDGGLVVDKASDHCVW